MDYMSLIKLFIFCPMTTWSFYNHIFTKYSIIEILVLPSVEIHKVLIDISKQFTFTYFIDTIGNIFLYNDYNKLDLNVVQITSIRKLLRIITNHKNNTKDALIVIDSVSFLSDINVSIYTLFYSMVNTLCLKNNCTVICTNHYRQTSKYYFTPRLGLIWSKMVKHRIYYKYSKDEIIYEIE